MAKKVRGIFVSYRRGDTAGYAGRLTDRLDEYFGDQRVFHDVDSIDPGLDFVDAIQQAISSSEVLLAVIGRNWLTVTDASGQKRLQNSNDLVRMEIATALKRNKRVIPVLVQGASMPDTHELPNDLIPLARRNAFELHENSWGSDVQRLITTLEVAVGDRPPQQPRAPTQPAREKQMQGSNQSKDIAQVNWVKWIVIVAGLLSALVGVLAALGTM